MKNRIKYIDIAKSIAIIIIVIGHTLVHSQHCSGIFRFLYMFNIALFFILSGYTFKINCDFKPFIKRKFVRIMIPYFAWSTFFIIPYLIFGSKIGDSLGTTQTFNIFRIIKNTLYGNGIDNALKQNTSLWFLPALFSMECFYYFIIKIKNDKYDIVKFPILFIIGVVSAKFLSIHLPWGINTVIQIGVGTFYTGYLLAKYDIFKKIFKPYYMVFFLLIGIAAILINTDNINYVNYTYGNYFIAFIIGISISLIIIYISYLIKENKVMEYIGRNTMGILIFHKIIILIIQTKLGNVSNLLRNSNLLIELLLTFFAVAISIIFSLIVTKIIRKICPILIGEKSNKLN